MQIFIFRIADGDLHRSNQRSKFGMGVEIFTERAELPAAAKAKVPAEEVVSATGVEVVASEREAA